MNRSNFALGLLSLLLVACGGGGGSSPAPVTAPLSLDSCPPLAPSTSPAGSLGSIVDGAAMQEMKAQKLVGLTVAVAKNGVVLYAKGYGYSDLGACTPAQADTRFQIGSVTKQFTAAAILQLRDAGSLKLDEAVLTYLPAYQIDPRITLRMLLNQTSGLADFVSFQQSNQWINGVSEQTVLTAVIHVPLQFTPGTAFQYSNSNYYILGMVIEAVTGGTYADYLASHILAPAGLSNTSYLQPMNAALPYTYTNPAVAGAAGLARGIIPDPSWTFAAGVLWSDVGDLAKWNAALRNGAVIPAASLTEMTTPPASVPIYGASGSSTYAMGLQTGVELGHPYAWHNGRTLAYTAFNQVFLDDGFSVSALSNVDIHEDTPLYDFTQGIVNSICTSPGASAGC